MDQIEKYFKNMKITDIDKKTMKNKRFEMDDS